MGHNDTWTPGSGWTKRQEILPNDTVERYVDEDRVIGTATTTQATFTTGTSNPWSAVMATFKPATTQSATTTTLHIIHTDHLGGTNVVTNASGTLEETLSYYPFGSSRLDTTTGFTESKKFTGHEYDTETGLYYMQARYQNPSVGRFVSEDPSFLNVAQAGPASRRESKSASFISCSGASGRGRHLYL